MKLVDNIILKEELSGFCFSEDEKGRIKTALKEAVNGKAEPNHRGKVVFRVALIAAALTLILGIGVIAEQRRKGLAERIISAESEMKNDSVETITKETLFDRTLNTIDYFDTVSVLYERTTNKIGSQTGQIHVNLSTAKAYEHLVGENEVNWERFSDGGYIYLYYPDMPEALATKLGPAVNRLDEELERIQTTPRVYFDEQEIGHWLKRENYTNASLEKYCLVPSDYVIVFLNNPDNWEITGNSEYLGRTCVEVNGVVPYSSDMKYDEGVKEFSMTFDKITGFLLKLSLRSEEGDIVETITVTEITVDNTEYTDARIEEALSRLREYGITEPEEKPVKLSEPDSIIDINLPTQITKSADDEELSQEAIYNRMLNSVDYYDTATVSFANNINSDSREIQVTVDTDLRSHKAFSSETYADSSDGESFEDVVSDGNVVIRYNNETGSNVFIGESNKRTAEEDEYLAERPRHYIAEEGFRKGQDVWRHRSDLSNSALSDYCLFPENMAFTYLTDFSVWKITGEKEYLGRNCIVIEGTSGKYAGKYRNTSFCMCIDEATGILMIFEGYDGNGEVMNYTRVTDIKIDQPEITCVNLERKISNRKNYDRVRNN